jgi:hypothetical protein
MHAYPPVGFTLNLCYDYCTVRMQVCCNQSMCQVFTHTHAASYSLSPQYPTKQTIDTRAISPAPPPPFSLITKFPCNSLFRPNTNTTTPNQLLFTESLLNLHSLSLPVSLSLFLSLSLVFLTCLQSFKHFHCTSQAYLLCTSVGLPSVKQRYTSWYFARMGDNETQSSRTVCTVLGS